MMVLLSMVVAMLLSALGGALLLASIAETQVAASFARGLDTFYAADGAIERAISELAAVPDWSQVLDGTVRSSFVDGAPAGLRLTPGGAVVDLSRETNLARCGKAAGCAAADLDAVTTDRPWGRDNPRWQLFAYGPMSAMLPAAAVTSPAYVAVWVGDDPSEHDNRPLVDGAPNADGSINTGRDVVVLLGDAYGPLATHRRIEVTVARAPAGAVRVIAWRELRQ